MLNMLTASDVIEMVGIIISLITSIVAIWISVKTLKQNSQMIEESTRPYISLYVGTTYFSSTITYLIIKNFGQSSAVITDFSSSIDLSTISYDEGYVPFSHIVGSQLCPGEAIQYPINVTGIPNDIDPIVISLKYKSQSKIYSETIPINIAANFDTLHMRANTKDQHIKEISFELQHIDEKML